jgi:hypothetical protein
MDRLSDFRKFYNHTLYPELRRMERRRIRLLLLFFGSGILVAGTLLLELWINNLLITLLLAIPLFLYTSWVFLQLQKFIRTYKPRVMNLILTFIQQSVNYRDLVYQPDKSISKATFLSSRLFATEATIFRGEDFISGLVGELEFELCELHVEEKNPVTSGMRQVFKGIFIHATLGLPSEEALVIWPRKYRHLAAPAIQNVVLHGAINVDAEILHPGFREAFTTYATLDTHVAGLLPITIQEALLKYLRYIEHREAVRHANRYTQRRQPQQRYLFLSMLSNHLFVGLTEENDLLEPYIFKSNLSFDLVLEYYEEIRLMLKIVEDIDQKI